MQLSILTWVRICRLPSKNVVRGVQFHPGFCLKILVPGEDPRFILEFILEQIIIEPKADLQNSFIDECQAE